MHKNKLCSYIRVSKSFTPGYRAAYNVINWTLPYYDIDISKEMGNENGAEMRSGGGNLAVLAKRHDNLHFLRS